MKPDRRGPLLPARGPGSPDGGVVGDRGRGGDGVGKGGSGTKTADAVPWLEEHSFKSAQGSYVSIKGSEDRSEEVIGPSARYMAQYELVSHRMDS